MDLALANLFQIALITVGLLGMILTLGRPRLRAATALMAMAAVWMSFNLLEEAFGTREIWLVTPAFRLAYPPLFFLLVRSMIFARPGLTRIDGLHFIPFLLALALTPYISLVEHAARVSLVVYAGASIWILHRFHRANEDKRSDAASINLRILYLVIAVFISNSVFDVIRMDARWLHQDWPWLGSAQAYNTQLLIALLMTGFTVYFAVRRESLFEGLSDDGLTASGPGAQVEPADARAFERLDALVREQDLFTEPRLTRAELAQASGLPERQVSQLIRTATGRSFNDYINALRIEDVKVMMQEDAATGQRRRLLDLAYTAGFSSKSVFNAVFKRETGQTPSAFAQSLSQTD
ncbi:MAG: helix-turn-helix transcriptional regulator [Alphaproteobacteria bacterium]|nr:helix-turn-helix transcriptional regulator [Alphaproteobacteria bacterium]